MLRAIGRLLFIAFGVLFSSVHAQGPQPSAFAERVTINTAQADLLRAEAQLLSNRINQAAPQIRNLEASGTFGTLKTIFVTRASMEVNAVSQTRIAFVNLSQNAAQRQAAQVFFGDLIARYTTSSNAFKTFENAQYPRIRDNALQVIEDNKYAYSYVAMSGSLTFDLDVNSTPVGAAVSYRRAGDSYLPHPNPTATTVRNLTYAVWTVKARLANSEQEKEHNPYRESNHVVHFDFQR
jgi:hypothetical protein